MPAMSRHFLCTLAVAAGIGRAGPAAAEIATDMTAVYPMFRLFWADGSDAVRASCPQGAVTFDHASCQAELRRVPEAELYAEMALHVGEKLPELQAALAGLYLNVERVDAKILEALTVTPSDQTQALRDKLAGALGAAVTQDTEIKGLDDQIARVKDELARHPDPDLMLSLRALESQRLGLVRKSAVLHAALEQARQDWYAANATTLDAQTFNALQRQRAAWVAQIGSLQQDIDGQLDERAALFKLFDRLHETGYVYEHRLQQPIYEDTQGVVMGTQGSFANGLDSSLSLVDLRHRTYTATTLGDPDRIDIDVASSAPVHAVDCAFKTPTPPPPPADCFLRLTVTGPLGFRAQIEGDFFYVAAGGEAGHVTAELQRLVGWSGQGRWTAALSCASPQAVTASNGGTCTFIVDSAP